MINMSMDVDLSPITEFIRITRDVLGEMQDERWQGDIVKAGIRWVMAELAVQQDLLAQQNPHLYHHVYEWGQVGEMQGRLWYPIWGGHGNIVTVSYGFNPSVKPIPERAPGRPRNNEVFVWKAPILEDGAVVTVEPGERGFLSWYDPEIGDYVYTNQAVTIDHRQQDTVGQVAELWLTFWYGAADSVLNHDFAERYEAKLAKNIDSLYAKITRGQAVPKGGYTVRLAPRQTHNGRAHAKLATQNNVFMALAQAREAAAGVSRARSI